MSVDGSIWRQMLPHEKVHAVRKMARDDMTARQIADALGTAPRHVRTLADNNDILITYHISPDKLPTIKDGVDDTRDTFNNRRQAAWKRMVEGARQTRLKTLARAGQ